LTLFHPASGQVRAQPVERATNAMLHPWLKQELSAILADLPPLPAEQTQEWGHRWSDWGYPEGYAERFGWPPVRMVLIWDNLVGHTSADILVWCHHQGIALLYTPLGGSWLNMAESVQRILVRRTLWGQHPHTVEEIMDWLAATVRGWNADPTPFCWGGKRWQRRQRFRERHPLGGSGAYTRRPIRRKWQPSEHRSRVCSFT
jgi:transposase